MPSITNAKKTRKQIIGRITPEGQGHHEGGRHAPKAPEAQPPAKR